MKDKKVNSFILIGASALRLIFGWALGASLPVSETFDDWLMVDYAMLANHFTNPNPYSLVKYMSFPLILTSCRITHIPYTVFLSLLWIAAALVFYQTAAALSGKRAFSVFAFLYMLFLPMAFDFMAGTRIYRNGVIAPFTSIVLSLTVLSLLYLFREQNRQGAELKSRRASRTALFLLAVLFPFVYYLKEDSLWLLAFIGFGLLTGIVCLFVRVLKKSMHFTTFLKRSLFLLLPILSFLLVATGYRALNYHFFGVFETNTRTGGEGARFAAILYSLDSPERTAEKTVPADVLEDVFRESETLSGHPELMEVLKDCNYSEDGDFYGDYICWGFREAMFRTGLYGTEREAASFLRKVNEELEEAIKDGRLTKSSRIQLLSSAGGRTIEEILELADDVRAAYLGAVHLEGYSAAYSLAYSEELSERAECASLYTGMDLVNTELPGYRLKAIELAEKIFSVYRILTPGFLSLGLLGMLVPLFRRRDKGAERTCGRKRDIFILLAAVTFFGCSALYAFSISWFSSFLYRDGILKNIVNFYQIALPVLLAFFALFGCAGLFRTDY